jgi:hypothetical protein
MSAGALTQRRRYRLRHVPYVESDHELMIALSVAVPRRACGPTMAEPSVTVRERDVMSATKPA